MRTKSLVRLRRGLPLFACLTLPACGAANEASTAVEETAKSSQSVVVQVGSTELNAVLGQGYDVAQQSFKGACIASEATVFTGQATARLAFDRSMTRSEIESDFGVEAEAKARYGLYDGTASAKFRRTAESDSYSIALVYSAVYSLPNKGLDAQSLHLTPVGESARDALTWPQTCGDEAVSQIRMGGRFYLVYRMDFSSKEVKDEFNAKVNVNAPFGSLRAQVDANKHLFTGKAKMHLEALQIGGDVTQISRVISGVNGAGTQNTLAMVTCDLGDLQACETFVLNAVDYAANADAPQGFPTQLQSAPAEIAYVTQPWLTLGVQQPPAIITEQLKEARGRLQGFFDERSKLRNRVDRLLENGFATGAKETALRTWRDTTFPAHFQQITGTVKACYDDIDQANLPTTVGVCEGKVGALLALPAPAADLLDAYGTEEQILKKWSELGGASGTLGAPTGAYTEWAGGGLYRDYQGGAIFWHPSNGAFVVKGTILQLVRANALPTGVNHVGFPTSDEQPVGDGRGTFQTFTGGAIFRHVDYGTYVVPTRILTRLQALGGARGVWGYPKAAVRADRNARHVYQEFAHGGSPGAIHHALGVGAFETVGAVHTKYTSMGDATSRLGAPIANGRSAGTDGTQQRFERGSIVARTSSIAITSAVHTKWLALGAENGRGWPTAEMRATGCQEFDDGAICQSTRLGTWTGAEIHRAMHAKWADMGKETGTVGVVTGDETKLGDGVGRHNKMMNGALVKQWGKPVLHIPNKIYEAWDAGGEVTGCLGYPKEAATRGRPYAGFPVDVDMQRFVGGVVYLYDADKTDHDHRPRAYVRCQ